MVDWSNYLFRTAAAYVIGFSVIELIDRLLGPADHEVQEAVDRFRKVLEDAREKKFNDSVEECISDFEAEIEKKLDDCLGNAREVLEASYEEDGEKLVNDVDECLTDIKKLIE